MEEYSPSQTDVIREKLPEEGPGKLKNKLKCAMYSSDKWPGIGQGIESEVSRVGRSLPGRGNSIYHSL